MDIHHRHCVTGGTTMGQTYGKTLGQAAFEAYNAAGENPGKTHDGKDVPEWNDLGDNVRAKWEAAGVEVQQLVTTNRTKRFTPRV